MQVNVRLASYVTRLNICCLPTTADLTVCQHDGAWGKPLVRIDTSLLIRVLGCVEIQA